MPYSLNKISVATVSGVQRLRWAPKNQATIFQQEIHRTERGQGCKTSCFSLVCNKIYKNVSHERIVAWYIILILRCRYAKYQ